MSNAMIEGDNTPLTPPDNPNTVTGANVSEVQGFTKSQVVAIAQKKLRGDLSMDLIGKGLPGFLTGMAQTIGSALSDAFNGVANSFGSWASGIFGFGQSVKDGQEDLASRSDLLSPLLDYCSVSIPPGSGDIKRANNRYPFTYQIGPSRGVTNMGDGRLRLDDKGLWDIRVAVTMSWHAITPEASIYARVLNPSGDLHDVFSEQGFFMKTNNSQTMQVNTSVCVPAPGYFVDCYVICDGGRGTWIGPKWSRLTVQHISRKVENGTGGEGSSEIITNN